MMDILMSETCWAQKKWNKIASDIKLVFHSSSMYVCKRPLFSLYLLSLLFPSMVASMFYVSHQWWALMMSQKQVVCAWILRLLTLTSNGHGIIATSVPHHQTKSAFGKIWNLMTWLGSTKNKSRTVICGSAGQFMEGGEVRVHFVHGKSVCVF